MKDKILLFEAGKNGYYTYRIPVIAITCKQTVLAFSEARRDGSGDYAEIDLVLKRKEKGGVFSDMTIISPPNGEKVTYNNLSVIIDGEAIHLIFCKNYLRMFHTVSFDDGKTFSTPEEITYAIKNNCELLPYAAVASGPSGAVVTKSGRYLVPCWIARGSENFQHENSNIFVLYSDDKGKTWAATDKLVNDDLNASEGSICNLSDGSLIFNFRHLDPCRRRAYILSRDGLIWNNPTFDDQLNEQCCMAGFFNAEYNGKNYCLFCNPDYRESYVFYDDRKKLTLKISDDDCKSWKTARVVEEGFSGYSDIAAKDGKVVLLYERAEDNTKPYDLIYEEYDLGDFMEVL